MFKFVLTDVEYNALCDAAELIQSQTATDHIKSGSVFCMKKFIRNIQRMGRDRWYGVITPKTLGSVWHILMQEKLRYVEASLVLDSIARQGYKQDECFLQTMVENKPGKRNKKWEKKIFG